jgi:hypothetical protein
MPRWSIDMRGFGLSREWSQLQQLSVDILKLNTDHEQLRSSVDATAQTEKINAEQALAELRARLSFLRFAVMTLALTVVFTFGGEPLARLLRLSSPTLHQRLETLAAANPRDTVKRQLEICGEALKAQSYAFNPIPKDQKETPVKIAHSESATLAKTCDGIVAD